MKSIEAQYSMDKQTLEAVMRAANTEIKPADIDGSYRTGSLVGVTKEYIVKALGFEPNIKDDPDKVENSWAFTLDGHPCAIWDWKGSHHAKVWSVYDPHKVLDRIFDMGHLSQGGW